MCVPVRMHHKWCRGSPRGLVLTPAVNAPKAPLDMLTDAKAAGLIIAILIGVPLALAAVAAVTAIGLKLGDMIAAVVRRAVR